MNIVCDELHMFNNGLRKGMALKNGERASKTGLCTRECDIHQHNEWDGRFTYTTRSVGAGVEASGWQALQREGNRETRS